MCGIFGMIDYGVKMTAKQRKDMLASLALHSEDRGTDAGGIAFTRNGRVRTSKAPGAVTKNNSLEVKGLYDINRVFMGHTRMTTQGSAFDNHNNHPFLNLKGNFASAHNGVLSNDRALGISLKLPKTPIKTDSYVAVQMLDELHKSEVSFETLKDVSEQLKGTFNLTFIDDEDNIWLVKNNNPLIVLDVKSLGVIIYASTEAIIYSALAEFYGYKFDRAFMEALITGDVEPKAVIMEPLAGDIVKITRTGKMTFGEFTPPTYSYTALDSWEYYQKDMADEYESYACGYAQPKKVQRLSRTSETFPTLDSVLATTQTRALIHNGKELEATGAPYTTQVSINGSKRVWSRYLGATLDLSDTNLVLDTETFDKTRHPIEPLDLYTYGITPIELVSDYKDLSKAWEYLGLPDSDFTSYHKMLTRVLCTGKDIDIITVPTEVYDLANYIMYLVITMTYLKYEDSFKNVDNFDPTLEFMAEFTNVVPAVTGKIATFKNKNDLIIETVKMNAIVHTILNLGMKLDDLGAKI